MKVNVNPITIMASCPPDIKLPVICITKQPCGWAIEPNKSFSLICKATASKGDVTYQWYKDGRFLPNEQKSELKRYCLQPLAH